MSEKIIIVDTDVVSHFIYAGEILSLPSIFKTPIKILDQVFDELKRFPGRKKEIENLINFGVVEILPFPHENEQIRKEYFHIKNVMFKGDGESACLAVARYTKNILASSNLRDVSSYCKMHDVLYLTTMDFLCQALRTEKFTLERCNHFINAVLAKKNKLPVKKIQEYSCRIIDFVE